MAAAARPLAAVLLLVSSSALLRCSSSCPQPCTCNAASLINCSDRNLSSVPPLIADSVVELDLSRNRLRSATPRRPRPHLRKLWLGNNTITHLSLCLKGKAAARYLRGRVGLRRRGQGCVSWAPALQLLSADRNHLQDLPEGLEHMEALQILQLSFNKISSLEKESLSRLHQLKELHLQKNHITSLHPETFHDLVQLRVLDLSFNMLTSLQLSIFLPLRNIQADVRLGGNKWHCDCNMRSLRRWMVFDSSRSFQSWSLVCASPSVLSGRDVLHLKEDDLNCFSSEKSQPLHQDVTVYGGSEILLPCAAQDSVWWTPNGQLSVIQPPTDLLLKDVTARDTGLYMCVSEGQVVVVYNLQIKQVGGSKRSRRDSPSSSQQIIPQDNTNTLSKELRSREAVSDLALAVCLSIFFTFIVAFILGVLARPCIDVFCESVNRKKNSNTANANSSVEQTQYDNDGYSFSEEGERTGAFQERRITFSTVDYTGENNVKYYDTVAAGDQEGVGNNAGIQCEATAVERHSDGDPGSESSLYQNTHEEDETFSDGDHHTSHYGDEKFEPIPDPSELKDRRSLSSSSESSLSEKGSKEVQMVREDNKTPTQFKQVTESVQQKADLSINTNFVETSVLKEGEADTVVFSSEPFAEWSPHTHPTDNNVLHESEYSFELSDSGQSTKSNSLFGSVTDPKQMLANSSDKQNTGETISLGSYSDSASELERNVSLKLDQVRLSEIDIKRPGVERDCSFSDSSDCDKDPGRSTNRKETKEKQGDKTQKVVPMPRTKWPSLHNSEPSGPPANQSSSHREGENTITDFIVENNIERENQTKKYQENIKSFSSDYSMDQTVKHLQKQEAIDFEDVPQVLAPASQSSSSSGSEDEGIHYVKRHTLRRVDTKEALFPSSQSPEATQGSQTRPPTYNTVHTPSTEKQINYHPSSSSSSSDSEMETDPPNPEGSWPVIDLQHVPRNKRYLDVKTKSAVYYSFPSNYNKTGYHSERQRVNKSSSSSDSEDESSKHLTNQEKKDAQSSIFTTQMHNKDVGNVTPKKRQAPLPPQGSRISGGRTEYTRDFIKSPTAGGPIVGLEYLNVQTESWPTVNLQDIPHVTKRLDVKAQLPYDSSSSSDSEDKMTDYTNKQRVEFGAGNLPLKDFDPNARFPSIDLESIPHSQKRLEIKAPTVFPESSSSSESENGGKRPIKTIQKQDTQWPVVDLRRKKHITRRLDFKVRSRSSESSSSSKDEIVKPQNKQEKREEMKLSQADGQKRLTQWPVVDVERTTRIKRHLDVKVKSRSSESSSSSDSENETTKPVNKHANTELYVQRPPVKSSEAVNHSQETQWPLLDLDRTTRLKRRLAIKRSSPSKDTSSSSESDNETTKHTDKQRLEKLGIARIPSGSYDLQTRWPILDLEYVPRIRQRLDIKPFLSASNSSSSSSSEDESATLKNIHENVVLNTAIVPSMTSSQRPSQKQETQWPVVDVERTTRIKRRLDIKVKSRSSESSSSSDSENEITKPVNKQQNTEIYVQRPPVKPSETVSHSQETKWPLLDLDRSTRLKRRLAIKTSSLSKDTSSSSESDNETTKHTDKQRLEKLGIARIPSGSYDLQTRWPILDLEYVPRIRQRLDIKPFLSASSSSSSSSSEDESATLKNIHENVVLNTAIIPSMTSSQRPSQKQETQWPVVDVERTTRIKRRLDVKVKSRSSESSSSSDSENETTKPVNKQPNTEIYVQRPPVKPSETVSHSQETKWPLLDLDRTTRLKRRLAIKTSSLSKDTSSSSESDNETTKHTDKQRLEKLGIDRIPSGSYDLQTRWPILDLEYVPRIRQRLDIKPFLSASNSSSSSSSEDESATLKNIHEKVVLDTATPPLKSSQRPSQKQETQWPVVDVERPTCIKRRLDVKVKSRSSESSSSSDNENDTTKPVDKQPNTEIYVQRPPVKPSETVSHSQETKWPLLDLDRTTRLKRRLAIKTSSLSKDTSSSSESDNETTKHTDKQRLEKLGIDRIPSGNYDLQTRWPILDLEYVPRIRQRLDIKPFLSASNSSSSSSSEDESATLKNIHEKVVLDTATPPLKSSQRPSQKQETQWPVVDVERTTRIKRRLDVKVKSRSSESSSSSDNENDTTKPVDKQPNTEIYVQRPPVKPSETVNQRMETQWPLLDLDRSTRLKRRLAIKTFSPSKDTSSSSESDNETTKHTDEQRLEKLGIDKIPSGSYDLQTRWPILNLEYVPRIRQRLDIKPFLSASRSSSSSSSEDESATLKNTHENVVLQRPLVKLSETVSHSRETQWPLLDLDRTTRLKRRLAIKTSSPSKDTSSSSESDDETTSHSDKQRWEKVGLDRTPSGNYDLQTRWPILDLDYVPHIRQRLDIKPLLSASNSSSSSSSEDEGAKPQTKQEKVVLNTAIIPPLKSSQRPSQKKKTQWPVVDVERTTRIKRRLNVKVKSRSSEPTSSSDSENETTKPVNKHANTEIYAQRPPVKPSETVGHSQDTKWPLLDLDRSTRLKRRLAIQSSSPSKDTSSSSESDNETTKHTDKQRLENLGIARIPSGSYDLQTRWPILDLEYVPRVRQRLDIKPFLSASNSSSSSSSEDESATFKNIHEKLVLNTAIIPPLKSSQRPSQKQETQWPVVDVERTTRIKRRLDVKVKSRSSESSSSSDSENEAISQKDTLQTENLVITRFPSENQDLDTKLPAADLQNIPYIKNRDSSTFTLKRRLNVQVSSPSQKSSSSSHESDNEMMEANVKVDSNWSEVESYPVTNLDDFDISVTYKPFNSKRLEFKVLSPELNVSSVLHSQKSESSSATSESEDEKEDYNYIVTPKDLEKDVLKAPTDSLVLLPHSSLTDPNIKMEKYQSLIDDSGNQPQQDFIRAGEEINPELQSQWATMNLGFSRFRKRLEISPRTPDKADSPVFSFGESETGTIASRARQRRFLALKKLTDSDSSIALEQDNSLSMIEDKSETNTEMSSFDKPHVKRNVDVVVKEKHPVTSPLYSISRSSSSSSEAEMEPGVPDLTFGVPHIKRRLNIKAPSPEPSMSLSSTSESEKWTTSDERNRSDVVTDNSLITYKRLIMKSPSLPGDTGYPFEEYADTGRMAITQERDNPKVSVPPKKAFSLSLDDVLKKIRPSRHRGVEMSPDIRWTGIGHNQLDLSSSPPSKSANSSLLSPVEAPPKLPDLPPPESSNSSSSESDAETEDRKNESNMNLREEYSSFSADGGSLTPGGATYIFDKSPGGTIERFKVECVDGREGRGLSALKAKFSERLMWNTENVIRVESPSFVGSNSEDIVRYQVANVDGEPFSQQLPTPPMPERRDFHYGTSYSRKYESYDTDPPQEAPPPVPTIPPPPDEELVLNWRSPQSGKREEWDASRGDQQKSQTTQVYDSSNISQV